MSIPQLSSGSLERLLNASPDDSSLWEQGHVLQLLSLKKIGPARDGAAPDRFRIVVSDGIHYTQAMLATQLTNLIDDGNLRKNTVIKVEKLTCNVVKNTRLFIVLSLSVIAQLEEKIGDPFSISHPGQNGTPAPEEQPAPAAAVDTPNQQQQLQRNVPQQKTITRTNGPTIYPIESLSPYQNKWTIRARVTMKSDIHTYSNQKGEGKVFNVTLMDASGEIRATGFNQDVDALYEKLEEGKLYYVSKARVNLARKKFSNINNEYELMFNRDSEVVECEDQDQDTPQVKYSFVSIADISNLQKDATCDVIAVVTVVDDIKEITAKNTGRVSKKRELTLVDRSEFSIQLTLWGKQAETFSAEENVVIAFKGARVGEFGGRSLSMSNSSQMFINPDITEAHVLRGWFDSLNGSPTFKSQTGGAGAGSSAFRREDMNTLAAVKESQIGMGDSQETFSCRATVVHIKSDTMFYPSCRNENCNKKVLETNEGWRCEKCDRSFSTPDHCYMMSMSVADHTGQAWLNGFNDVGNMVFGKPASEMYELKEQDESAFNAAIAKANCNTFNFACRARQDTYNETTRVRYGISKMFTLDYRSEACLLRDILKSDWAK